MNWLGSNIKSYPVYLILLEGNLPKPVLLYGVLRKSREGAPPCVLKDKKVSKAAETAWGTVKAAVLKRDSHLSNLIMPSCYNQKPCLVSILCRSVLDVTVTFFVLASAQQLSILITSF